MVRRLVDMQDEKPEFDSIALELAQSFENGGERLKDEAIGLTKPLIKFIERQSAGSPFQKPLPL